jgi:hypothetical protein
MKRDETFIQIFLDFLNDKTANGDRFAARLERHPYVIEGKKQGFDFYPPRAGYDWQPLRRAMSSELSANVADGASVGFQRRIVDELNRLRMEIPIFVVDTASRKPALGPDGKPIIRRIVALATFQVGDRGVEFGGVPIVNGLEFACWYALLLVSRIPGKVKRCTRESCQKWFNEERTGRIGFCSDACSTEHNRLMQQRRQYNRRHPRDRKPIIRATAEKHRKI